MILKLTQKDFVSRSISLAPTAIVLLVNHMMEDTRFPFAGGVNHLRGQTLPGPDGDGYSCDWLDADIDGTRERVLRLTVRKDMFRGGRNVQEQLLFRWEDLDRFVLKIPVMLTHSDTKRDKLVARTVNLI